MRYDLDHIFMWHAPSSDDILAYAHIREVGKAFAQAILSNVPEGADQDKAIESIRQAVMFANAGVALKGSLDGVARG